MNVSRVHEHFFFRKQLTKLYSLFFLLQLGGIAILAVGVAFFLRIGEIEKIFDEWNVQVVPILFIVIGAIIFIVAFFGCCGAIKESHCMTVTVCLHTNYFKNA